MLSGIVPQIPVNRVLWHMETVDRLNAMAKIIHHMETFFRLRCRHTGGRIGPFQQLGDMAA